jgi:ABC-2 type transport system permease protein
MAFFPDMWDARTVLISVAMSLTILVLGVWVFRKLERPVLKGL